MNFEPIPLAGAFLLRPERVEDERGFFARSWSRDELEARGLDARLEHASVSWNRRAHTLRGLHYQLPPLEEAKVVSCLRGAVHDVIVDLRPDSPTLRQWFAARLDPVEMAALYVPPGCAHGFLTLEGDTLVQYLISAPWSPELARGVRFDDPALGIVWPAPPAVVNERDRSWPLLPQEGR